MNGISMSIKVTPNYAGLSPLYYDVGLYPLAVPFDKLVAALTCPNFDLGKLQEDVPWSVLRAAVGTNPQEICSVDKNPFEGSDGYTWAVAPDQTALTYVAKKDGKEAFRIIFPVDNDGKSEPRVWVNDADSYQSKDAIKDLADSIIKQRQYANYCINFNGRDYYANCEAYRKQLLGGDSWASALTAITAYSGGCMAGTAACAAALMSVPGVGWTEAVKAIWKDAALGCVITPTIAVALHRIIGTGSQASYYGEGALAALSGIGVGTYYLPGKLATKAGAIRKAKLVKAVEEIRKLKPGTITATGAKAADYAASMSTQYLDEIGRLFKEAEKIDPSIRDKSVQELMGDAFKKLPEPVQGVLKGKDASALIENDGEAVKKEVAESVKEYIMGQRNKRAAAEEVITKMNSAADDIAENVKNDLVPKISRLKTLGCNIVGAVTGTLSYYTFAHGDIKFDKMYIELSNPSKVVSINIGTWIDGNKKVEVQ